MLIRQLGAYKHPSPSASILHVKPWRPNDLESIPRPRPGILIVSDNVPWERLFPDAYTSEGSPADLQLLCLPQHPGETSI